MIPLIASADPARANRDPENEHDWRVDRKHLVEDLWALALWLQREASDIWLDMSTETKAVGRDWERWRSIMAVARLFERHGVADLEADIRHVMSLYQDQKDELEGISRITFVIKALIKIAQLKESDVWTFPDVSDVSSETLKVSASEVAQTIRTLVSDDLAEGEQVEEEGAQDWINSRSVGKVLSKLRLPRARDPGHRRDKFRTISPREIVQLAIAHHVI